MQICLKAKTFSQVLLPPWTGHRHSFMNFLGFSEHDSQYHTTIVRLHCCSQRSVPGTSFPVTSLKSWKARVMSVELMTLLSPNLTRWPHNRQQTSDFLPVVSCGCCRWSLRDTRERSSCPFWTRPSSWYLTTSTWASWSRSSGKHQHTHTHCRLL